MAIADSPGRIGPEHSVKSQQSMLREVLATHIELLIEILDRMDGDPDAEVDAAEDEGIAEYSLQPAVLGPRPRSRRPPGFRDGRGQASFSIPGGLRQSVRTRLELHGSEVPTDSELLGALLSLALPRRNTEALALQMIAHFGGFSEALAAPIDRMIEVKGMGRAGAANLKIMLAAARRFGRAQIDDTRPIVSSWTALIDYCRTTMAFERVEQFRLLFLDKRNRLIADEVQQTGTVDHTPVYPREVIKRTLELNATALILVHNHPTGDPTPSQADVRMTKEIISAGDPLGITVHDHLVIGANGNASMKALRLI